MLLTSLKYFSLIKLYYYIILTQLVSFYLCRSFGRRYYMRTHLLTWTFIHSERSTEERDVPTTKMFQHRSKLPKYQFLTPEIY